ncbi:hypothetical protein ACOT99_18360 [Acinetobacter baumannii]|uniref:Uncharacterized protein n=5 Tax=Acinetobacter calcoaceticus/baumannii complex TaxID=909768 RepID=A0A8I0F787_ACIBA|nr:MULTISPECIES: hypothetical protein [Acinetobacter calcoaceticus/baumannii complex]EYU48794.1 hypothetical protein J616_02429 [Acinetobacter baumannii 1457504]EGT95983.1 hypothetical protein ABNIH1_03357 [Acinetobacter baumannii ABNIH1]EGY5281526.1 hypothetical protein [Acinetobacter baumannii]EHU1285579.1 hypothetical protein [Acinetobacter baumannii]EHU1694767.1 hypothetical protein [Acinetobacter baumannii]
MRILKTALFRNMKFKIEIFQILSAAILITVLFMAFTWICIHYQKPEESFKEAISLTVSFMGVIATVVAALIAVLMFNDWKIVAKFERNKEIINEFWLQYIKVKSELVLFGTKITQANEIGTVQKYEVLDSMSDSFVKLYYLQQKLESFFDISETNKNFTELEKIIKSYTQLLAPSNEINSEWQNKENLLINRLNLLQPKLYKELKQLNPI